MININLSNFILMKFFFFNFILEKYKFVSIQYLKCIIIKDEIETNLYFSITKLKKNIFHRIELDKFIFFKDEIKKITIVKLRKIRYDKNENKCFLYNNFHIKNFIYEIFYKLRSSRYLIVSYLGNR